MLPTPHDGRLDWRNSGFRRMWQQVTVLHRLSWSSFRATIALDGPWGGLRKECLSVERRKADLKAGEPCKELEVSRSKSLNSFCLLF